MIAVLLPFYVMALYGGKRSVKALWPVLLVSGVSFAAGPVRQLQLPQLCADRRAFLAGSLIVTLLFLQVWRPAPDPAFAISAHVAGCSASAGPAWQGWLPWILVSVVVIAWTHFKIASIGQIVLSMAGAAQRGRYHAL